MEPRDRTGACVAIVAVGFAVAVVAVVRPLGLVHPFGATLIVELLRAPILGACTALCAWLLLRRRDIESNVWRTRHDPGMGRSALSAWLAGTIAGGLALCVGAIPDPTDAYESVVWLVFGLSIVGGTLGFFIGPLFGVIYAAFASRALQRSAKRTGDMVDGALGATAWLTGAAGVIGALAHASAGVFDVFGFAVIVGSAVVAILLAVRARRRATWITSVAKGEVRGWKIVPIASLYEVPDWIDGGGDTGVLFVGGEGEGNFRTMPAQPTPVAFLDVTTEETVARLAAARVRAVLGAIALILVACATFGFAWFRDLGAPSWGSTPIPISRLRSFRDLQGRDKVMCARRGDGRLACWGSKAGALFGEARAARRSPSAHPTLGPIRTFALGDGATCVVEESGDHRASCFTVMAPKPTVAGPPEVVSVAITKGSSVVVAATADGAVWQWEAGAQPTRIEGLPSIKRVAATNMAVVALAQDGSAWCWGRAPWGGCSDWKEGDRARRFAPGTFDAVAANPWHMTLIGPDKVEVFGHTYSMSDDLLRDGRDGRQVAEAGGEACKLHRDGKVVCTRSNKARPNVVLHRDVLDIAGSEDGFCAATQRALWCWNGYSMPFMQ